MIIPMRAEILIVLQTAWRVGKDGVEAGTNMVPVSCDDDTRTCLLVYGITYTYFLLILLLDVILDMFGTEA